MESSEILIKNIIEEIPTILIGKFEEANLSNLEEILSINFQEFCRIRGVGRTAAKKLQEFQERVRENLEEFSDLQTRNTKIHNLPMGSSEILIKNIIEEIPTILIGKFEEANLSNLEEILSINFQEFCRIRGVGRTAAKKLQEFQERVRENLEEFSDLQTRNTKIHNLPVNEDIISTSNFLDISLETVTDFLNLLPKHEHRGIINHLYGLNNSDIFTLDDLSLYYQISKERIRQLKHELLDIIKSVFQGEPSSDLRCHIRQSVSEEFKEIQDYLSKKRVFSFLELLEIFRDIHSCDNASENKPIINLLIDLFGFSKCRKAESIFTKADLIVVNEKNKKNFLKAAHKTLRHLKKKIIPISEMQAVIEIIRSNKTLQNSQVIDALNVLPEIEILDSEDQTFYQVKFEHLSSASDRTYRVLLEKGNPMYIDNIVSEINHRLAHTGTSKIYDRHSFHITSDKRFVSMAKTGFWILKEWNNNIDKLEDLVKKALYKLNMPSTYDEIFEIISAVRPNIKEKSVRAIIGRDCLKVTGNKWIMPEWKQKYSDLAFVKRKKRINTSEPEHRIEQRALVIKYLDKKPGKKELASKIIKEISPADDRFSRVSFYKLFEQEEYFIKDDTDKLMISLYKNKNLVL